MFEHFPEPEERIEVGQCSKCEDPIYNGDEVVDIDGGYICQNCKKAESFKAATVSQFKEFIENHDLEDEFAEWFFEPNTKVLGGTDE